MTRFNINRKKTFTRDVDGIREVSFDFLGEKVYSATRIEKICGTLISQPITAPTSFIKWKEADITLQKIDNTDVSLFLKSANSESELENANWVGPFLNEINDITDLQGKVIQFLLVLCNFGIPQDSMYGYNATSFPIVEELNLSFFSSDSSDNSIILLGSIN